MHLEQLLGQVDVVGTVGDPSGVDVTAVTEDSRRAGPGSLYCCVVGQVVDGHDYAAQAVSSGSVALLCERPLPLPVAQVLVPSVRPAMAQVAAELYGRPSGRLKVIGVTGTNGKTTVTHMLQGVLSAHGWPTAVLGTLSGARTTPSAPDLQESLAGLLEGGTKAVAMEVSSHALVQHRVDAVEFSAAVFTNLSRDHLDYHGSMEAYFQAKALLFVPGRSAVSVINVGDPWGRRLADAVEGEVHVYSPQDASGLIQTLGSSEFDWRGQRICVPFGGDFNVVNALAAATTASALGVPVETIAAGLAAVRPVPGRMQLVDAGQPYRVLVDFAHTPDGLDRLLGSVRSLLPEGGRLAVVFGCGGDRDAGKRPEMGRLASQLADLAVVTSDNPRSEDPLRIIDQIMAGATGPASIVVEPDRRAAIKLALDWAEPGDVVVLAGKGHETGQVMAGVVRPFDDVAVARELLAPGAAR